MRRLRVTRTQILRVPPARRSARSAPATGARLAAVRRVGGSPGQFAAGSPLVDPRTDGRRRSVRVGRSSLVQVWGPRYHVYVVAARDLAVFSLGRLPDGGKTRLTAVTLAARLHAFLGARRMRYDEAGRALGVHGNTLRYAALTGTLAIRWEGARLPVVWTVPPPAIEQAEASLELARRYLHVFGPSTPDGSPSGRASAPGRRPQCSTSSARR